MLRYEVFKFLVQIIDFLAEVFVLLCVFRFPKFAGFIVREVCGKVVVFSAAARPRSSRR